MAEEFAGFQTATSKSMWNCPECYFWIAGSDEKLLKDVRLEHELTHEVVIKRVPLVSYSSCSNSETSTRRVVGEADVFSDGRIVARINENLPGSEAFLDSSESYSIRVTQTDIVEVARIAETHIPNSQKEG